MARRGAGWRPVGFVAAIATLMAVLVGAEPAAAGSGGSPRWPVCGAWRPVAVPGGGLGSVTDVAVVSPTDAWAISDHGYESWNESHVYRWTGLRWTEVRFPIRPSPDRFWVLTAIAAVTATEASPGGGIRVPRASSAPERSRLDGTVRVGRWFPSGKPLAGSPSTASP